MNTLTKNVSETFYTCFSSQQKIDIFNHLATGSFSAKELTAVFPYNTPYLTTILLALKYEGFANYQQVGKEKKYYLTDTGKELHSVLQATKGNVTDFFSVISSTMRLSMLRYVYKNPGCNPTEIALNIEMNASSATIFSQLAEKAGIIERHQDGRDKNMYIKADFWPLCDYLFG